MHTHTGISQRRAPQTKKVQKRKKRFSILYSIFDKFDKTKPAHVGTYNITTIIIMVSLTGIH
jgi:hypothetical protein